MPRTLFYLSIVFMVFGLRQAPAAEAIPALSPGDSYARVRSTMQAAGWQPFHAADAARCLKGDARCQGRPEMLDCAPSGLANCKFLWKKHDEVLALCTAGEDAVFSGRCPYP